MQAQYARNFPAGNQRSPQARPRGPGPIVPLPHQQRQPLPPNSAQSFKAAKERDEKRRLALKPTDRTIPDGIEDLTIGDGVQRYKQLREVERRLDATMTRKRNYVKDSVNQARRQERIMRLWISNTVENQPWQLSNADSNTFDFSSDVEPKYTVKIEGRLLDDDIEKEHDEEDDDDDVTMSDDKDKASGDEADDTGADDAVAQQQRRKRKNSFAPQRTKLSHFLKSLSVEFDRPSHAPPDEPRPVQWVKPKPNPQDRKESLPASKPEDAQFDCLRFTRKGDENINITIKLGLDDVPEKFRLNPALANLLDTDEDDRAGIVMGIWEYVLANGLAEDEESRRIKCDEKLKAVFGQDTLFFPYIPNEISAHITPIPPVEIPYTIRVDKEYADSPTTAIYDVRVPTPSSLRLRMHALTVSGDHMKVLQEIVRYDEHLALTVQALTKARAKHTFLTSMSKDPVRFIRRWISSQQRDFEVLMAETVRGSGAEEPFADEWRKGGKEGVWNSNLASESVSLWLARNRGNMVS